jgi:quercetin 2,3-dioxygenase
VRVIAGEAGGVRGPVRDIYADPEYLDIEVPPRTRFEQAIPRGHAVFAYVFRGAAEFGTQSDLGYRGELDGDLVEAPRLVVFGDGDAVRVETGADRVRFLLVSGAPLGEPIARYGPFVMTTRDEIQQALRDLNADTFIWRDDPAWLASRRS